VVLKDPYTQVTCIVTRITRIVILDCPVVVGGDLNIPVQDATNASARSFAELLASFDMTQHSLLDMSAAFDCVDHSILMQYLQSTVGLSGVVLDWIKSFLSDQICYNGQLSAMLDVLFGVLQGSVLGPLLYILVRSI